MSLNNVQKQAVTHKTGPCMVLAGPGSGKTTVITERVKYLIEHYGVKPEEILVITFSKAASKEMRERFHALNLKGRYPVTFGTFHGIYYGILKWAYGLTGDNIFSEEQKAGLLQQIAERIGIDMEDEKAFVQDIAGEISCVKSSRMVAENFESEVCDKETFLRVLRTYEKERMKLQKVDFDDMLLLTYRLFQERTDILEQWQKKYEYILIDEFQDINQVQYDVIRMLAAPENNLFIVGDDDQSIYRFRGAKPELMLNFPKDYPGTKRLLLDLNYRSTKAIVNGAARVIQYNKARFTKQIVTSNEQGATVHIQEVKHPVEESEYVIKEVQKAKKTGIKSSDIAVLFRTNVEARALIETCMEYNMAFYMREHLPNLYEHFISRNLITYMKMALGDRSRKSFLEIMNRPNRYFRRDSVNRGEVSFEALRKYYEDKEWMLDRIDQMEADLRVLKKCKPYAAIQYIKKHIGYEDYLQEYANKRNIAFEDLTEVLHEIEVRAKEFQSIESWLSYIEAYTRRLHIQEQYSEPNPDAITLMTMHGAKGLEFHTVCIIGANEDVMPYKKAKRSEDIEEERRLFYVAMTRAKKRLIISYNREKNGKKMKPSRFVLELLGRKK